MQLTQPNETNMAQEAPIRLSQALVPPSGASSSGAFSSLGELEESSNVLELGSGAFSKAELDEDSVAVVIV